MIGLELLVQAPTILDCADVLQRAALTKKPRCRFVPRRHCERRVMSTVTETPNEMLARMDCMVRFTRMDCTTFDEEEEKKKMSVDGCLEEMEEGESSCHGGT